VEWIAVSVRSRVAPRQRSFPPTARSAGPAQHVLALQRRIGNHALAKALAVQRRHWWVLEPYGREAPEREAMKSIKGIELTTSDQLARVLASIANGDTVTVQTHGRGSDFHWVDEKGVGPEAFAAKVVAALGRDRANLSFTLDVFACWSAGDYAWWQKPDKWSPKLSFVYRLASALNKSGVTRVTVRGYVGKTKVSVSPYDEGPYKETEGNIEFGGQRRSRRFQQEEVRDPSNEWAMSIDSGTLKVTHLGSKLVSTEAAKLL
jgi:hypothetical protein